MIEDKDFIGKCWLQNCGDNLLVTEKTKEKKRDTYLFRGIFQKYPYEILFEKDTCLKGKVLNPQIEIEEFIKKDWPQKCGDTLRIIEAIKKGGVTFWKCQFLRLKTFIEASKNSIVNGKVDLNIVGGNFLQNCGDTLLVIEKTSQKYLTNEYLYKCQFQKYPCEVFAVKSKILKGKVLNPQIEIEEFANKFWKQNCGDTLKVIEKGTTKNSGLWKCEFIKYPYQILAKKESIVLGKVVNPEIERIEFIDKLWIQNCGDTLRIIQKTNLKEDTTFLWKCEFLNYPCTILATKKCIKSGQVDNPSLPWKTKEGLREYIEKSFLKKPSLLEISQKIQISPSHLSSLINKYELRSCIRYTFDFAENSIRDFIKTLGFKGENKVFNKELSFQEIDILILEKNFGIEYNGNYWHSDKNVYKKYFDKYSHQNKSLEFYQKLSIRIFHIFEYEWECKENILKSLIKSQLGFFDKKIGARQCKMKEISDKEYQNFCNENHLQGEAGARIKLGLFFKNKLVQIMSFGVPRFNNNFEYEIIRECSKLGYKIIGGKEKLWKYFIKNYSPKNCISYCDFSKFTGESYLKLGFVKKQLNPPGFVWWDSKTNSVFWRNPYKNQEMKNKGYNKIYDCGQLVFEWFNKSN